MYHDLKKLPWNTTWWHWRWVDERSVFIVLLFFFLLRAILNKLWRQHPTRHQPYGHLPSITKTIQVRRTRLTGHCWRNRDELISYVLLWTPRYGQAKTWRSAQTYIQELCEDTRCSPEELPEPMKNREKWWERVRDIRDIGTWWRWWLFYYLSLFAWSFPTFSFFSFSFSSLFFFFLIYKRKTIFADFTPEKEC